MQKTVSLLKTTKKATGVMLAVIAGGVLIYQATGAQASSSSPRPTAPVAGGAGSRPAARPATALTPTPGVSITNIPVAADVNSDKVMMAEVNRAMEINVRKYPGLTANTPEAQADLKKLRTQVLDNMIDLRLLYQEAKRQGLEPTDKQVNNAISRMQIDMKMDDAAVEQWLKQSNKTMDEFRREVKEDLAIRALTPKLTAGLTVSEDEVRKFYDDNKADFVMPEAVRARHIMFFFPENASQSDKKKVVQKAQNVLKQALKADADFGALVKAHTESQVSGRQSGYLGLAGILVREDVPDKVLGDAIFSAPVGKVHNKLVESEFGVHIIKVETKKPSRMLALSEVGQDIKVQLFQKKAKDLLEERLVAWRKAAKIKKYI